MQDDRTQARTSERPFRAASGWTMLAVVILMFLAGPLAVILGAANRKDPEPWLIVAGLVILVLAAILAGGLFTVAPNMARVLLLFGEYRGTVRETGFRWTNPFMAKRPVSLRAHNLN